MWCNLMLTNILRIDNSGGSVNASALFNIAGMRLYQKKYSNIQPIINSIY